MNTNSSRSLWSHRTARYGVPHTVDELQALSRRYGNANVLILPLDSGKLAVFSQDRQLKAIVDQAPTVEQFQAWSAEFDLELTSHAVHVQSLRNLGIEEPSNKKLISDIHRAERHRPPKPDSSPAVALDISDLE